MAGLGAFLLMGGLLAQDSGEEGPTRPKEVELTVDGKAVTVELGAVYVIETRVGGKIVGSVRT